MLLQPDLGGREQTVGDRQQPDFAIAMPAPIDGNGFEAEIDGREMGCGGDAGLAQDRGGKKPAKPRRVLQDGDLVPRIQGDDRLQHRRQILRLPKDATPFLEALVFVPVEIVDQRISFAGAGEAGRSCLFDGGVGTSEHRIDGGELGVENVGAIVFVFPLPSIDRLDIRIRGDRYRAIRSQRCCWRAGDEVVAAEAAQAVGRQSPARWLRRNPPARPQNIARNRQFVGRCADILCGVVKNEVLEMDELAVDPQRGAGIGKVHAPRAERAMRSSRRASLMPASEIGRGSNGGPFTYH